MPRSDVQGQSDVARESRLTDNDRARALRRDLEGAIEGDVRFDRVSRALYATDASVYQIIPLGVVMPRSRGDVVRTVQLCREHAVSITARGGGTSQAGQAIGLGVQLDFSRYLNRVLALSPQEHWVRVEPGIVLDHLNHLVKPYGLHLPLDISTSDRATIGGMIANNASGTRSVVYGKTIDYVLELTAVLSDGSVVELQPVDQTELESKCAGQDLEGACYRIVRRLAAEHADEIQRRFPRILRRVGGYNLDAFVAEGRGPRAEGREQRMEADRLSIHEQSPSSSVIGSQPLENPPACTPCPPLSALGLGPFNLAPLIVGSEGTLALVLEAKLRLAQLPPARAVCVVHFHDLLESLATTPVILAHAPSAVELLDRFVLDSTRGKEAFERLRGFVAGDPAAVLIVEFIGEKEAALSGRLDQLEADLRGRGLGYHFHRAMAPEAQAQVWRLRRAALGLSMSQCGDAKAISFVEDTAVAPDRLRDYIERFRQILDKHRTQAGFYAHASVGLLHVRPVVNLKTADGVAKFQRIAEEISELVLEFGGALSGEHGDGIARSAFQQKMYGPVLYEAFCQVKRAFDPLGIFNPGKIVDAPPMTANLRFGPGYRTPDPTTALDFADFGGMARAAEQCAGIGECRKTQAGTMCPSYIATREERDSTRGRANVLRLALSGQIGLHGLHDPDVYSVLELCLECKACKTECPTGVDMARMKSEFLHQYGQFHGRSLRSRLLAHADRMARWGSGLAPLSNWVLRRRSVRWLGEKWFGLDRRRILPNFARRTFLDWWQAREQAGVVGKDGPCGRVAFFADTFTNYYEPAIAQAAVRLGEAAEWKVVVPERICCGRPLISKGLLDEAKRQAEAVVSALYPLAQDGVPIVFCEPSCYSAVRDDHPHLLAGELQRRARAVSAACYTFEQWAAGALARTPATGGLSFRPGPPDILLHVHCHQRALVGTDPAIRLLSLLPTSRIIESDAGCCGMAGSFGYEHEHYEISRQVCEDRLLPAIRTRPAGAVVVAPGFSCRHQIQDFARQPAMHPAELLESLLATGTDGPPPGTYPT